MRLYKNSDRIKVKIFDMVVTIAPLKYEDKLEIQTILAGAEKPKEIFEGTLLAMRCAIKDIKGLELEDGSEFELEFENNMLTESCAKELLNIEASGELMASCNAFVSGIPKEININGVEIVNPMSKGKKKKR